MKKKRFSKGKVQVVNADIEQKKTKNKIISTGVMLLLVFLMIFSIVAIGFNGDKQENTLEYNGFKFTSQQGGWFSNIDNINYGFEYSPLEVEAVQAIDLKNEDFGIKSYILYDPKEFNPSNQELIRLKSFLLSKGVVAFFACTNDEGCGDLPIADCNNTNKVIYLKNSNKTEINRENNCIVLNAVNEEEIKVINRFMYGVLGVING